MKKLFSVFMAIITFVACDLLTGNDFIEVSPFQELRFQSEADNCTLMINSSGKWIVGEVPTWIIIAPTEGEDGDEMTVSVTDNTTDAERSADIIITCGSASATVTVRQNKPVGTNYIDIGLDKDGTSYAYNSSTGTLTVTYPDTPPVVTNGKAIVLSANYDFDIRVIESSSVSGKTLSLETSQGNMADLFKNTSFTLATSPNTKSNVYGGVITPSAAGYIDDAGVYHESYNAKTKGKYFQNGDELWSFHADMNGTTIAQGSAGRLYWETCSFDAGLNGVFTFDFGEKQIDELRSKGDINSFSYVLNGSIDMDFLLHYHYEAAYSEEKDEIIQENIIRTLVFEFMVGTVPVYISVDTHLGTCTAFSAEGEVDATAGVVLGTDVNVGAEWTKDSGVRVIDEVIPYMELHHPTLDVRASAEANVSYYPRIDIRLYKFIGPWVEPRPYLKENIEAGFRASTDGDNYIGWKSETYAGLNLRLGLDLSFGKLDFSAWESPMYNPVADQLLFEAPSRISTVYPEDGTKVKFGETVNVEFLVESYSPLTGKYYPCPLALVNLKVDSGKLENSHLLSDVNGKAYAKWTPSVSGSSGDTKTKSSSETTRTMSAEVVDAEGDAIDDASLTVEVEKERPTPGQWVDLGLPSGIKWAAWNVGASAPEEYGGYFAWGETSEKSVYDFDTYQHKEEYYYNYNWYRVYSYIGDCISGTSYDVSTVRWGAGARMPTLEEIKELDNKCEWEGGYVNGVKGVFAVGPNSNSIFIPFAGLRDGPDFRGKGDRACLWSGARVDDNYTYDLTCYHYNDYVYVSRSYDTCLRAWGLSVRPVLD